MEQGYIVEIVTSEGRVCERYATYEEACRRIEQLPAHLLLTIPLIYQVLPDGSERLVRDDGKPLQWHRLWSDTPPEPGAPLPVFDGDVTAKVEHLPPPDEWPDQDDDEPLSLG